MSYDIDAHLGSLAELWRYYSTQVYGSYSPLNCVLAGCVAADPDLLRLVLDAPPPAHDPNVLLAAIHYLVLGGVDHPIGELYTASRAGLSAGPLLRDFCLTEREALSSLMANRRIQTNEVGRSAILSLGLVVAADRIGSPISLVDAGASAGLNLLLDEYLLDFGSFGSIGPPDSPVRVECAVRSPTIPIRPVLPTICSRIGIDRRPVDLSDPDDIRWLLACVWPGTGRLERTRAAIEVARVRPPLVSEGDMVAGLPGTLEGSGFGPAVVVTSWSFGYLSTEERFTFCEALAQGSRSRPVAWICADSVGVSDLFAPPPGARPDEMSPSLLGLAVYRAGRVEAETLAMVHPHGAWIDWAQQG